MSTSRAQSRIVEDLRALEAAALREVTTPTGLAAVLRQAYESVLAIDLDRYDLAEVKRLAPGLMQAMFELRLALRDRIPDWQKRGLATHDSIKALRDLFRALRFGSDMLGEIALGFANGRKQRRAFTGAHNKTFVHPLYDDGRDIPYRSGDVIMIRGIQHNSAAIARIGDVDSQFSHIGVVYVDGDKAAWFVESLIEVGAVVSRLEHALDHGVGRAVLFRHRDGDLAERAARFIHDRVQKSRRRWHKPILYDFSFRLDGYRELFCSKLVRQAYQVASNGKLVLPAFKTRFDQKNRDFLDRVGVKAKESFAPGDMDVEHAFDLVAEWQDFRQTSSLRLKDLMMEKIFEWMERDGWVFRETAAMRLVSLLGRASSHLSEEAKDRIESVFPRVPVNMPRRTVAAVAMLHKTGEEIMVSLKALEDDCIRVLGRPAHPREIYQHLEQLRANSGGRIGYLVER